MAAHFRGRNVFALDLESIFVGAVLCERQQFGSLRFTSSHSLRSREIANDNNTAFMRNCLCLNVLTYVSCTVHFYR